MNWDVKIIKNFSNMQKIYKKIDYLLITLIFYKIV
jgi:hypothetical protein